MNTKNTFFSVLITLALLSIIALPIKPIQELFDQRYRLMIAVVVKAILIALVLIYVTRKYELTDYIGVKAGVIKKYWLLIIPLLYPGAWAHKDFEIRCSFSEILLALTPTLVSAMWEEFVFRGVIQGYLVKNSRKNLHSIVIFTSLLFAFGHLLNLRAVHPISVSSQVIFAFMTGMLFSAIHLHVRNIWLLGISHGLLNFLFNGCGITKVFTEETEPGISEYVSQIGGFILISIPGFLIYWLLMRFLPRRPNKQE